VFGVAGGKLWVTCLTFGGPKGKEMAITSVRYLDFSTANPGDYTLPTSVYQGLDPGNMNSTPIGDISEIVDVPSNAESDGILAFTYATRVGRDSSVDIVFNVNNNPAWTVTSTQPEFRSMHFCVPVVPGQTNSFVFNIVRGGTADGMPPWNAGGSGLVLLQNIVLIWHNLYLEQDGWAYCTKCKGLFFPGNPGNHCPAGGTHDGTGSGNYSLRGVF
jgi:hypothetical protein